MSKRKSRLKKWFWLAAKLLLVALVLGAVWGTLRDGLAQLADHRWHLHAGWLGMSGIFYLLGVLPASLFWHHVLHALGQEAGLAETIRAYYIGHLGKYVPGKALVVVLRAGLVRSHRVSASVAAVSVFFETFTMMAVGAFMSAAILAAAFRDQRLLFWISVALMVLSGLPTFPPIFKRLVRLARIGQADPATADKIRQLGPGTLVVGWIAMAVGWLFMALSLWAVLEAMGVEGIQPLAHLPLYTASVALAVVAGFVSLIPGGFGVRDMVLAQLMVPYCGPGAAVASAVLLRLVWLVSELLISVILYFAAPRHRARQAPLRHAACEPAAFGARNESGPPVLHVSPTSPYPSPSTPLPQGERGV